ncbi:MAG: M10 family metallopeptidase C-terminal domain-containing protein [Allosphingosinicella sp.]
MPRFGQNFTSRLFAEDSTSAAAFGSEAFSSQLFKLGIGFVADGLAAPGAVNSLVIVGPDEAGDGIGVAPGNPTITVDAAAHTIGTINTIGDQDFYAVTLEAGKTYEIGLFGYSGGPNLVPLQDSFIELYNAAGVKQAEADGGASTLANQVNSGFDAVLNFTATATGTYYIDARAFDNNPANGTTGEGVGDYELYVHVVDPNDPNVYHPYYNDSSPLYAIDWGTRVNKVNQTAANPDGNEGPRPTGNAQGTPTYGSALDMNALLAANGKTAADIAGKNVITIYFAKAGEIITSVEDPTNPGLPPVAIETADVSSFEHLAVMTALHQFEKVADVVYLEVQSKDQADFEYASYKGTPGPGISLLGSMEPPDEPNEGLALFNSGDYRWNATDLQQGGFSFVTLIHEIGHGHGLAHPHDNGGHSGIMHGVEPEGAGVADYTTGDYALNQSVYTMMSYEDGWQSSPYGNAPTTGGYGYLGGLMAFDIAAIQDKYGVNEDWATGDDVYTMKDENAPGTFFTSIWDAGGTDQIVYNGARDTTIDLRAATLKYEVGGGGFVSYAYGIFGGYTIANSVVIENAKSGSGNDKLTGNAANNVLDAGDGNDNLYLWFGGGNDTALAGAGNDLVFMGATLTAADIVDGGTGNDTLVIQGNYSGGLTLTGNVTNIENLSILAGSNTSFGETGTALYDYVLTTDDANFAPGIQARVNASALLAGEDFTFNGSAETDASFVVYGGRGTDTLTGGLGNDIFFFAEGGRFAAGDTVNGGAGYDSIFFRGNYTIDFNAPGYAGLLTSIESMTLSSATDTRYARGGGTEFDYDIKLADAHLAAGVTLTVNGGLLQANETMNLDGSQETDGFLRLFGGAASDILKGGGQADLIHGNLGADTLTGGGGADTFRYQKSEESTSSSMDHILDFTPGTDKIELTRMDANTLAAGNQDFHWIGSGAFAGTGAASAGELRAYEQNGTWFVEGDTNGDGTADLVIALTLQGQTPLSQSDFLL